MKLKAAKQLSLNLKFPVVIGKHGEISGEDQVELTEEFLVNILGAKTKAANLPKKIRPTNMRCAFCKEGCLKLAQILPVYKNGTTKPSFKGQPRVANRYVYQCNCQECSGD